MDVWMVDDGKENEDGGRARLRMLFVWPFSIASLVTDTHKTPTDTPQQNAHDIATRKAFAFSGAERGRLATPWQPGRQSHPSHASLLVCGLGPFDRPEHVSAWPTYEAPLSHVHTHASPPAAKPLPALVWSPAFLSSRRLHSKPPTTR